MHVIDQWHRLLETGNVEGLNTLLAEDAVFHSPVVHSPQRGRALTAAYLGAAFVVLGNDSFRYLREIRGEQDAMLEFQTEIDGIVINGVDIIHWNNRGEIDDFKVMLRPLKAVNLVHQKMAEMLSAMTAQDSPRV
ncbi:nuclear transport factor 2 family protein [Parahaliea mediterranea]|uniref:nuclear transport factor 2 family protein n=1 Tax=Parahaliea mediterranea TaxID=651086 RepID=UPI000E2E7D4D|nr:nuclear transport factor 2 family protein [Parahaliea mediterranea]